MWKKQIELVPYDQVKEFFFTFRTSWYIVFHWGGKGVFGFFRIFCRIYSFLSHQDKRKSSFSRIKILHQYCSIIFDFTSRIGKWLIEISGFMLSTKARTFKICFNLQSKLRSEPQWLSSQSCGSFFQRSVLTLVFLGTLVFIVILTFVFFLEFIWCDWMIVSNIGSSVYRWSIYPSINIDIFTCILCMSTWAFLGVLGSVSFLVLLFGWSSDPPKRNGQKEKNNNIISTPKQSLWTMTENNSFWYTVFLLGGKKVFLFFFEYFVSSEGTSSRATEAPHAKIQQNRELQDSNLWGISPIWFRVRRLNHSAKFATENSSLLHHMSKIVVRFVCVVVAVVLCWLYSDRGPSWFI